MKKKQHSTVNYYKGSKVAHCLPPVNALSDNKQKKKRGKKTLHT